MGTPSFDLDHEVTYGVADRLSPSIERVTARNPSKFTFKGTGTYLLENPDAPAGVVMIDPGPDDDDHHGALERALGDRELVAVLITHTHGDHSPLAARFDAPAYGFGPHPTDAADEGEPGEGDGAPPTPPDVDFVPDVTVDHGDAIEVAGLGFEAIHTPGHISNHLCFAHPAERCVFTGDHVMGWSTTIIPPPDGDMAAYVASLELLAARDDDRYYPTHGPPVDHPGRLVRELIAHRRDREAQIAEVLRRGPATIPEIVGIIYADVPAELHRPAARSTEAHLLAMIATGDVVVSRLEDIDDLYRWVGT